LLLSLLNEPEHEASFYRHLLYLLGQLPTAAAITTTRLRALLADESQQTLHPDATRALMELSPHIDDAEVLFTGLLARNDDPVTVFVAAGALCRLLADRTPVAAEAVIMNGLATLGQISSDEQRANEPIAAWYWWSSWPERGLDYALQSLWALGEERAGAALLQALPLMHEPEAAQSLAEVLLDLLFMEGKRIPKGVMLPIKDGQRAVDYWKPNKQPTRQASELGASQRAALQALAAHEPYWQQLSNLLEWYGLPGDRQAIQAFLQSI
jgi:hypothetical protein